jgi:hypothetical protein
MVSCKRQTAWFRFRKGALHLPLSLKDCVILPDTQLLEKIHNKCKAPTFVTC